MMNRVSGLLIETGAIQPNYNEIDCIIICNLMGCLVLAMLPINDCILEVGGYTSTRE
jgi:hypothetical protein